MKKWQVAGMMLVLVLGLSACGNGSENAAKSSDPKVIMSNSSCLACHGQNLQGMGSAPNLTKVGSRLSKEQIAKQIKNGGGGMPGGLIQNDKDIEIVADYLSKQK